MYAALGLRFLTFCCLRLITNIWFWSPNLNKILTVDDVLKMHARHDINNNRDTFYKNLK